MPACIRAGGDAHGPDWLRAPRGERLAADRGDPLARQLDHFCDVVEHGTPPAVPLRDGLAIVAVAVAAKLAARHRRVVSLDEVASW